MRAALAALILALAGSSAAAQDAPWWRAFADPTLDRLVERGLGASPGLDEAAARLAAAEAQLASARSARTPEAGVSLAASQRTGPLINAAGASGGLFELGAGVAYRLDLFGTLARGERAARLDANAQRALLESARLGVGTAIAETYFQIRALDRERRLVAGAADSYAQAVEVLESRRSEGLESALALDQATAEFEAVRSETLALQRRREALDHALAVLTGAAPAGQTLDEAVEALAPPPPVPAGVSSAAVSRRPDVLAAQLAAEAQGVRVEAARRAWFPDIALTASGGFASSDLAALLRTSAQSVGLGAIAAMPIFDGGRRKARVRVAEAEAALAAARYRSQTLSALQDVADQLSALRTLGGQSEALEAAALAGARARARIESRYADGFASRLDVLDARRTELRDARQAEQVRGARLVAYVGVVRALGGTAPETSERGLSR